MIDSHSFFTLSNSSLLLADIIIFLALNLTNNLVSYSPIPLEAPVINTVFPEKSGLQEYQYA